MAAASEKKAGIQALVSVGEAGPVVVVVEVVAGRVEAGIDEEIAVCVVMMVMMAGTSSSFVWIEIDASGAALPACCSWLAFPCNWPANNP